MLGHEIDDFGCDLLGGDGKVAFILAILVVDNHDNAALAKVLDRIPDGSKWHGYLGLTLQRYLIRHAVCCMHMIECRYSEAEEYSPARAAQRRPAEPGRPD